MRDHFGTSLIPFADDGGLSFYVWLDLKVNLQSCYLIKFSFPHKNNLNYSSVRS